MDGQAYGPVPAGDAHGWARQAELLGSGLYRIELTQGTSTASPAAISGRAI
jgi:hypothetical protein